MKTSHEQPPSLTPRPREPAPRSRGVARSAGVCWLASLITLVAFAAEPKSTPPAPLTSVPLTSRITIEPGVTPPPAPLFFSATTEQILRVSAEEISGEAKLRLRIHQGRPDTLTIALVGDGDVLAVTGPGLRDWAVRQGSGESAGKRFLDLRPVLVENQPGPRTLELTVRTRRAEPAVPGKIAPLLLAPGDAVGFEARVRIESETSVDLRIAQANGLIAASVTNAAAGVFEFVTQAEPRLELMLTRRGATANEAELIGVQLTGRVNEPTRSVEFLLRAQARSERIGARLPLLAGRAALSDRAAGDGWHVELAERESHRAAELVFDKKGLVPIELRFVAALERKGDWQRLEFQLPGAAIVPLTLGGLGEHVEFDPAASVVPTLAGAGAQGFVPGAGEVTLGWKRTRDSAEGALSFTSTEQTDIRVGAGVLRQTSLLAVRVLQGKLNALRLRLDGPGEVIGVEGENVLGWQVRAAEGDAARWLDVQLSRPLTGEGMLTVRSQATLGAFPVRAEALRLTPEGGVRHAGFVRIANSGAVRIEVADVEGMMQLAPAQFPGSAVEAGTRQAIVYRFAAGARNFRVLASAIVPEVGVSAVIVHELTETDRVIAADVELDVREAPLREWTLQVPADHAVVGVQGPEIADYAVESAVENGTRTLKIIFGRAIEGRHLLRVRLEKNQPAGSGEWALPALGFPQARTVRGYLGAVAAAGYRVVPATAEKLVEVPLSFFPKQVAGLQQAWRLREAGWRASVNVEALPQSVQADVFHLYALKEGEVSASVLLNYFVVGAPVTEWRVEVPAAAGHIDVTGQGARREWRREGNTIVVPLQTPVLGAATLLLTFSEPMSARGGTFLPGAVRPLNVQSERGYVQVVSPLQVRHRVARAESLLKLEPLELPAEYRLLSSSPSLAVFQYTARPFALELAIEWYQPGETVEQVIDFAKFATQVSRDGQVVTEAEYFVKTRGRKALRLQLPRDVKLWEARVENETVTARADGEWTLVPLPARLNPSEPVKVVLRLGQNARDGVGLDLATPKLSVPMVLGEWTLQADTDRLLVPRGGTAQIKEPNLTETGFEWITTRGPVITTLLLGLFAFVAWGARATGAAPQRIAVLAGVVATILALALAGKALIDCRPSVGQLNLAATMVPADGSLAIEVANAPFWLAMISWWGVAAELAGIAMIAWLRANRTRLAERAQAPAWGAAIALLAAGVLAQRLGAAVFFLGLALVAAFGVVIPLGRRVWREWRTPAGELGAASTAITLFAVLLAGAGMFAGANSARAAENPLPQPALQSLVQRWEIRKGRLFAEADIVVRGRVGESFVLLWSPAILTEFSGEGLRLGRSETNGQIAYHVAPEREGTLTGRARFELAVPDFAKGIPLPTGPAALQRVTVLLDQGGWEFGSPMAVQVQPTADLAADRSGATLVLGPSGRNVIQPSPRRRDPATEPTQFFAELATLFLPAPGVVNGTTRVTVRPVQGRVAALEVDVPSGFTVGDVARGPIGAWRFDPEKRRLHVALEPAQTDTFQLSIETQRAATTPPFDLELRPLRVLGAAGEVGTLALAFGNDAQPEALRPEGLSPLSTTDFDAALLPRGADRQPLATLHSAFRHLAGGGALTLRVAPVAPEVRVTSKQVLSLGDDRVVLAADLNVAITRVGLFKLGVVVPAGFEVEAISGAALAQWTEAEENGARIVTLHLNGRTLGVQTFALTFVGAAPSSQPTWRVPQVLVREATRHTGELQIVPERGLRLRASERSNVSELDPRTLGNARPGSLAFRLLQADWALTLALETLDPWVTVQALQEITAREGQTLTRINARLRVDNAAIKTLRVRLPGLNEEQARSVRATGAAVSDIVPVAGTPGAWEIRFQRGIAGETPLQIEFQGPASRPQNREEIVPPVFEGARQVTQFVAVRSGGRLELEAPALPRGWQRLDWSGVPAALHDRVDRSVPAMAFRAIEPEGPLVVQVRRHEIADALKLRVTGGTLTTLFSPHGPALTAVELQCEAAEKSTLRARLPEGARLFNTFVNGESVSVVREGDAYLFHVAPGSGRERGAKVRFVYAVTTERGSRIELRGPALNVPLENVAWRVALPAGYALGSYRGGLELREAETAGSFSSGDYTTLVLSKRAAETKVANDSLQAASILLQRGDQVRATEVLSNVSNQSGLDTAANEDARVQLRALKTQQAILGLNTRRQRLYLDNSGDGRRNEQLEQAAHLNPFLRGDVNWDPAQLDQLLMGNTAEENTALRGIAARIVEQQLSAEPAPAALDVTLPPTGRVLTFARSLQVDGGAPLELDLRLRPTQPSGALVGAGVLLALGGIGAVLLRRRET